MKKISLIILFVCSVILITAQDATTDKVQADTLQTNNEQKKIQDKGSYLTIGAGIGPTGLNYTLQGLTSDGTNLIKLGGNAIIGYSYYFNKNWGIGAGLGASYYKSTGKYKGDFVENEFLSLGIQIDDDNISGGPVDYELRVRLANWQERQIAYFFEIPVLLQYQTKFGKKEKIGMYFNLGAKFQIPIKAKYEVIDGKYYNDEKLNVSGYYNSAGMDLGSPNNPSLVYHSFGSIHNPNERLGWNDDINIKMSIAGTAGLGLIFGLSPRVDMMLGAFIDYGFNNVKKGESKPLFIAPEKYLSGNTNYVGKNIEYSGMVNSDKIDKANLFSYGAKIGIRIKLNKSEKQATVDTVYIERIIVDTLIKEVEKAQPVIYEPSYTLSYVIPPAEEVKQRSDTYSANLNFEVAKSEILQNYKNNEEVLREIDKIITEIQKDTNLTVTKFKIIGYSSPDGNTQNNMTLSEQRAKAFVKYLQDNYGIDPRYLDVEWEGEDWKEFRKIIEEANIQDRAMILKILDTENNPDRIRTKLKELSGGSTYRILLNDYFPRLRRNEYTIAYIARAFNIEEAKQMIKTKPQYLSLNEMFLVANSYPSGSKEFKETFDIAVRMYPDDPIAQNNVAALDIEDGAYNRGISRLENIDLPETWNNIGVAYAEQKQYILAEEFFEKAIKAGVKEASKNLEEMKKQIESNQ
ncbi:MAG: OmpA family protein [Bacteroidales bacterium]|jgi:outer membrane protein OmpA-like peptidoglycan-associated protein|nr:OmpA family protein [Bacteroidales bacterium]